jgi:hypothetical protein
LSALIIAIDCMLVTSVDNATTGLHFCVALATLVFSCG